MDSYSILNLVYEIQGAADPAHPESSLKERMEEIYEKACEVMRGTGFMPDDLRDKDDE